MADRPSICLVTPGHLVSTPRLVKSADALAAAGYDVTVISSRHYAPNEAGDAAILAHARWRAVRIRTATTGLRLLGRGLRLLTRQLRQPSPRLAPWIVAPYWRKLARAATAVQADYYLGHCIGAMPAVLAAARSRRVRFGIDLEDHHETETAVVERDPRQRALLRTILGTVLPQAAHLTAASPLIADRYEHEYGVHPRTILNVLPRSEAPPDPGVAPPAAADAPARCYWFSQVIGPGRGLEAFIRVMGAMRHPVELHLQGFVDPGYRAALEALAAGRRVVFHPFAEPAELARHASAFDLGLAIEPPEPSNREVCLSNKIFTYVLAGLPQLLSPTAAQRALAAELGAAALVGDPSADAVTAMLLDAWFADPITRANARRTAWELGQTRYCWEIEQREFLAAVQQGFR